MSLRVIVPPHPLISHWLTMLRNPSTPKALFATGLEELGRWLTYEAIRDWLPSRKEEVITDNLITEGTVIESRIPILVVPNLPGGLEMWQGARNVLPNANLCIGGLPKEIEENSGIVFLIDQISTGKTILKHLTFLKKQNIDLKRIRIVAAIACNPGLKHIGEEIKDLKIFCASIDPELISENEISPGIGNPTKRINTRITASN